MTRRRTAALLLTAMVLLAGGCTTTSNTTARSTSETAETPETSSVPPVTVQPNASDLPPTASTSLAPATAILRLDAFDFGPDLEVIHSTPFSPKKEGAEMMGGAAAGDFNNDGSTDLYFIGGGLMPDRLLMNDGTGRFGDIAEAAGLGDRHVGSGATVGDYNGDGWLDIYVTSHGPPDAPGPGHHRLYRNNGDLTFTDVAAAAGVSTTSAETGDGFGAAFGDYDLDGDLDLFVAGWVKDSQGNRLFRNNGDGTFTDVTDEAGIVDNGIRGFSPCLVDTNGDRYPEVLLVADFGTSRYFVNRRDGTFRERTTDSGTGLEWSGMGTAVGDFNRDGLIDWYTTAIYDDEQVGRGDGNKLYYNLGRHEFEEVAAAAGVADGGWGWGTVAVDLDLDGMLDLVETNGWELPAYTNELSKVWLAVGDGTFAEVGAEVGMDHDQFGLGVLHFDVDNDGDQDVGITTPNGDFRMYITEAPARSHWLRIFLDTSERPDLAPNGFGGRVRISAGGVDQYRWILGCSNFSTGSELSAHFGLGSSALIDELEVLWPDGSKTTLQDVPGDQTLTLVAP